MFRIPRLLAAPLALALGCGLAATFADASEIRDRAGMFSPAAVQKAEAGLNRIEKRTGTPTVIETIDAIADLPADATSKAKLRAINALAEKRDREIDARGLFILLSKKDRVLSNVLIRRRLDSALPEAARLKIRDSFIEPFKAGNYDAGLVAAVAAIDSAMPNGPIASAAGEGRRMIPVAPAPGVGGRVAEPRRAAGDQQFGLGTLLVIGAGILGVLFVVRLLTGSLGNRGGMVGPGPGMGGPGYGPGPGMGGPGYGAPGYGRGGGFFSGMLGGIGGALAGNWLYDQFSGRHSGGHHVDASGYSPMGGTQDQAGGDDIIGGGDGGGFGGSWGDSGGGDFGGGDWGGGDDGGSW